MDIYFTDRVNASSHAFIPPPPPLPRADQQGYFPDCALPFKDSSLTPAHPAYLLPDGPEVSRSNGVWGMIRRLRHAPSESLPALWKTQLISTVHSILVSLLQPQVSTALSALHPTPDVPLTALPSPAGALGIQVASHLLSHLILSPLEIVKTRLIAMPMGLPSTPSSVGALRDLIEREGGLSGLYLHPNLLIPTLLEHTLRPLLTLSIPLLLERQFNLSPDLSPITYSLCDLTLGLGSLLILLPIETVRKRLQIQPRDGAKRIKTIVRTREKHYVGVVEAMWRIMTEETGHPRKKDMKDVDEGGQFAGVRQLYRGVSGASPRGIAALMAVWNGGDGSSDGLWTGARFGQSGRARIRQRMERDLRLTMIDTAQTVVLSACMLLHRNVPQPPIDQRRNNCQLVCHRFQLLFPSTVHKEARPILSALCFGHSVHFGTIWDLFRPSRSRGARNRQRARFPTPHFLSITVIHLTQVLVLRDMKSVPDTAPIMLNDMSFRA